MTDESVIVKCNSSLLFDIKLDFYEIRRLNTGGERISHSKIGFKNFRQCRRLFLANPMI